MSENKTVYIVTSGEYSDYGINAVFLDKEMAEAYVERANRGGRRWDQCDIEEHTVCDDLMRTIPAGQTSWLVWIGGRDDPYVTGYSVILDDDVNEVSPFPDGRYRIGVYARDRDHALKIGQDRLSRWKAEQAGIA